MSASMAGPLVSQPQAGTPVPPALLCGEAVLNYTSDNYNNIVLKLAMS